MHPSRWVIKHGKTRSIIPAPSSGANGWAFNSTLLGYFVQRRRSELLSNTPFGKLTINGGCFSYENGNTSFVSSETMENQHFQWKNNYTWPFPIVMLNYQRVNGRFHRRFEWQDFFNGKSTRHGGNPVANMEVEWNRLKNRTSSHPFFFVSPFS